MPSSASRSPLVRDGAGPLYLQLADRLRADIQGGRYGPGVAIPSERRLKASFGVTRSTTRSALAVLRAEGLITAEQGAGAFVREPGPRRVLSPAVPAPAPRRSRARPGERAFRVEGPAPTITVERVVAPTAWAERLGIPDGTALCVRTVRTPAEDGGDPPLPVRTIVPWAVARGTALGRPVPLPAGEAAALRPVVTVTASDEWVTARMPDPGERRELALEEGVPVLELTREWRAGDQVVAFRTTVVPGDRVLLRYEVPPDRT